MPTSTDVTNLKINKLTQAQYDAAVQGGTIGENELSILTDFEYAQVVTPTTMPTLLANAWVSNQQTVSVTGVTTSNVVYVAPVPTSMDEYAQCGVYGYSQADGTVTFKCASVPTNDLTVNVIIIK